MPNTIIQQMIDHTNIEVKRALYEYGKYGKTAYYHQCIHKICGMLEMLQIATGHKYKLTIDGIVEA